MKDLIYFIVGMLGLVVLFFGLYLLSAAILMFLYNIVARYFEWKPMDYYIALIVTALLSVIGSFFKDNK